MEKNIITYFETTSPTTGNTIATGYNIGQHWFNSTTGVEYIHKSDGVWEGNDGYSNTGHTHSQYLTGYTETNPGVYTTGQTNTLRKLLSCGPTTNVVVSGNTSGIINISSIDANFNSQSDFTGNIDSYTVPALNGLQLVANQYTYITAQYNNGTPQYVVTTDNNIINHSTILNIVQLYWENLNTVNEIHTFYTGSYGLGLSNKIGHRLLHTERFGYESGLILGEYGTRNISISSGRIWYDGEEIDTLEVNTATSGHDSHFYYPVAGVFNVSKVTQYPNTQYSNGTNLQNLTGNKFTSIFVWKCINSTDRCNYIMLGGEYNSVADALVAKLPSSIPDVIVKQGKFIGRIVIGDGQPTARQITSELTASIGQTPVTDHNLLSNIQGGTTNEYYHLTSSGLTAVNTLSTTYSQSGHTHYQLHQPNGLNPFVYTDNGGNLHIDGNIYQSGSTYETHAQNVYTSGDTITLRENASAGLSTGEYAGFTIKNYDGAHDGSLKIDKDGWMRVGDVGSEQKLATIEEESLDGYIMSYHSGSTQLRGINPTSLSGTHTHSQYLNLSGGTLTGGLTGTTLLTTGLTTSSDFMSTSLNRTLTEVGIDTKLNTGVPYGERQKFKITVTSGTTVTASLSFVDVNTSFSYYISDKKFTVTSSNISTYTATGTSSGGVWFFYINHRTTDVNSPQMVLSKTPWAITDPDVLLWDFYVDGTNNSIVWIGEERHTAGRDIFNHARNHAEGAIYNRGFSFSQYNGLNNTTLVSNTNPNFGRAHVQIANGSFFDEDIKLNILHLDSSISSTTDNPSTDWSLNSYQYLGFNDTNTSIVAGTITFATPHTFITGQGITVMNGNTTTARGTFTVNAGGTGTSFIVTTVTGSNAFANGDIVVVGARIPIYYISSIAGGIYSWKRLSTGDFLGVTSSLPYTTSTILNGVAQYNNPTTAGFSIITSNRYYPVYLIATNTTSEPIIAVLGQGTSSNATLASALNESPFQFQNLVGLTDLGIQEVVPFMRLTYLYSGVNTYRIRLVNSTFLNVRSSTISGSFFGSTAPQTASSTSFTPYGNITGSTVQSGIQELDDIKLNKTDFNTHTGNTSNPHSVTSSQVGSYTTGETNTLLLGKSDTGHTHTISDVTNLQTTLDDKSNTGHTHDYLPTSGGTLTGNLTGTTFYGSGAGLTNVPASGVIGLNLNQITSGSTTASVNLSGFTVNVSGNTVFEVSEDSDDYLMEFTDVSGNTIFGISELEGDTLLDVIDTNDNVIYSVCNDGTIKQNSITIIGLTSSQTPYNVLTVSKTSCDGIYFDYVIRNTITNAMKIGTIFCVQDGTNLTYSTYGSDDLNGVTTGITLIPQIISSNIVLVATVTNNTWTIKIGTRKI